METVALPVQSRDTSVRVRDLLKNKLIPLEYYGRGVDNLSLQVDYQTFVKAYRQAGESMLIELVIDDKIKKTVLVHDMQHNPITDEVVHVDLINVRMSEEIHTRIPLEFVGTAPAVKEQAGTFMAQLDEVEVKCLPKDLVHSIEVPVDSLVDFNTMLRVSDIVVPEGITILNDPDDTIAAVAAPMKEEEPEAAAEDGEAVSTEGGEGEGAGEAQSSE